MANIMQQVKLKNHTSRDGFDLSHRNAFTAKIGELLPVSCFEVIPGDSYNLEVSHFTRTMPVNTAAYTRMREYYDWFFVPTNLLWNKFNTFVTQMTDNNQHATGINSRQVLTDTHPYFTTNQIHTHLQRVIAENQSTPEGGTQNILGFSSAQTSRKLLEYLGYGDFSKSVVADTPNFPYEKNLNLNPFPLLAYQKIYQDYYRHSQWENAYAPAFNIDYISGSADSLNIPVSQIAIGNGSENMFSLRYANWHKDLFMGLLPSAQYGAASIVDVNGALWKEFNNDGYQPDPEKYDNVTVGFVNPDKSFYTMTKDNTYMVLNSQFSILSLRQAEALQRWKEITQSQQQDYKNQVEAHFGVSPDNSLSDRCHWIDGHVSNLDISEVVNQNITADNSADIAGKGVGVGQGRTKFKSEVHGYLMCIYHCVPLLDYSITGVKRMMTKTKATDYAIPEFDRTGMVSVPFSELSNSKLPFTLNSELMGYAPRYYDYKQSIDVVNGGFKETLSHWVAPFDDSYITEYVRKAGFSRPLNYVFFKINPSVMNPIFAMNAGDTYESDQLLVNSAFDIKAVRNLDRNGLPY